MDMNMKKFAPMLALCLLPAIFALASGVPVPPDAGSVIRPLMPPVPPTEKTSHISRCKRGLTEDAERLVRQGSAVDVNNIGQLIDLVSKNKAEECLSRVICELSQNPKTHGDAGAKFAQALMKFRQSKHSKVKQFLDAMTAGAKAKSVEQCKSSYPACNNHSTGEIITAGNRVLRVA